jgi:hypothetical protein
LIKLRDSGHIEFIDGMKILASTNNMETGIEIILDQIKNQVKEGSFVIVDKVSLLLGVGISLKSMISFVKTLQSLTQDTKSCLVTLCRADSKLSKDEIGNETEFFYPSCHFVFCFLILDTHVDSENIKLKIVYGGSLY